MSLKDDHHPTGLPWLTVCYSLFMVAFGVIIASIVLYQTEQLGMSQDLAYTTYATVVALLWILPLGGGYLGERFGYTTAAMVGIIFCTLGFIALSASFLYTGLTLFVVGNALATPCIWCLVDHCYSKESTMRESGFTLFYLYFNIGVIFGIFFGGYLAITFGFAYEFDLGALALIGSGISLYYSKDKMSVPEGRTIEPQVKWPAARIWSFLLIVSAIACPICSLLFVFHEISNYVMFALMFIMIGVLLKIAFKQEEAAARQKMIAFIVLSLFAVAFWSLYSLEPSFLSVYIEHNVDRSFLGIDIPASSFFAFDSIFVILIGLLISRLWHVLSAKKKNPALSAKFALSLFSIGIGFCFLALVIYNRISPLPSYYIVIAYAIFAFAELLVSPLGISMVGSLAPEGYEGLMMGFWQLCSGIGGVIAGLIGIFATPPEHHTSIAKTNPTYATTFLYVGLGAIICAIVIACFVRILKRLMREHPYDRQPHI